MEQLLDRIQNSKTILIHTCCAPCLANPFEKIISKFSEPFFYFYNPNIYPVEEYFKRLETARYFFSKATRQIIEEKYEPEVYYARIKGKETSEDRCRLCYLLRLEKAAEYALENDISYLTTTLLSSPFQKHDVVREEGNRIATFYNLIFVYYEMRKTYYRGVNRIKTNGLYYQWYCGCEFSKMEREKEKALKLKEVRG